MLNPSLQTSGLSVSLTRSTDLPIVVEQAKTLLGLCGPDHDATLMLFNPVAIELVEAYTRHLMTRATVTARWEVLSGWEKLPWGPVDRDEPLTFTEGGAAGSSVRFNRPLGSELSDGAWPRLSGSFAWGAQISYTAGLTTPPPTLITAAAACLAELMVTQGGFEPPRPLTANWKLLAHPHKHY